jgi:hypothetical protein
MQSGQVPPPPFRLPCTSGVIQNSLLRRRIHYKLTGKNALIQRWLIQQGRDCGPLCASAECSASSVASYLPTNVRVVSLCTRPY